jgi:hypothetical protein
MTANFSDRIGQISLQHSGEREEYKKTKRRNKEWDEEAEELNRVNT